MILKLFFPLVILISFTACNNNPADPDFNYQKIITADSTDSATSKLLVDTVNKIQPAVTVTPAQSNTTAANTKLNPEHGKPGHRCDIAVGAPLNSKPVATTTPTTTTTTQQKPTANVSTPKTVTPPGMNPPHGEPGHRCDIAVGSPLRQPVKSTPAQNSKTDSTTVKDSTRK